jgi:aconitate hydratase
MDARSIAATAINKGRLTPATDLDITYSRPRYYFDKAIYDNRVYDGFGHADPSVEIKLGPNIKDWPSMVALTDNLLLRVTAEIHDPVTTTDELIPSGETSSYRSNPLGLAEFTLSRKDPSYVGKAKEVRALEEARREGATLGTGESAASASAVEALEAIGREFTDVNSSNTGIGSTIYAVKPGDGSAREQAASCQKVLGGWANIAKGYATKRYRSNLINWGMLPLLYDGDDLPFANGDYIFLPGIKKAVEEKASVIKAYAYHDGKLSEFNMTLGDLTDDERRIILDGCLINYYKSGK